MPLTISHILYSPVGFPAMQQHFYCRVFHALTFPSPQLIKSPALNFSGSSASSEPAAKDLYMNLAKSMRGGKSEHDL